MSNTLGTVSASLISNRVLDYLKEMFPPVLRMFINFTPQQVLYNQSILTRIPGASAAYNPFTSGYSAAGVTDTDVSVTVNKAYATSIAFTAAEMSATSRDLVNEHASAAANSLGQQLLDDMCALFVASAFTNSTEESAANYDDDTLRAIRKELNGRKVPTMGRVGIVNSDAFEALSGDSLVTTQLANPRAQEDYSLSPMVLRARGFEIIEYPQLPANSEDLNGVFFGPGALIGAVGVPADANAAGMFPGVPNVAAVAVRTDADTGLSILERMHKTSDGGIQLDYAWIYGFAKGNPVRLERVTEDSGS
jgi:hypothetical protein